MYATQEPMPYDAYTNSFLPPPPPHYMPAPLSIPPLVSMQTTKPILAERYKTKMCRNYLTMGMCPYEVRCMFAHGDAELRTKEMNLRDGLVTEDAIREFRRAQRAYLTPAPAAWDEHCTCQECVHARPGTTYTHDPYRWYERPCACSQCYHSNIRAVQEGWYTSAASLLESPAESCDCHECTAAAHNVLSASVSSLGSASVPRLRRPYSEDENSLAGMSPSTMSLTSERPVKLIDDRCIVPLP